MTGTIRISSETGIYRGHTTAQGPLWFPSCLSLHVTEVGTSRLRGGERRTDFWTYFGPSSLAAEREDCELQLLRWVPAGAWSANLGYRPVEVVAVPWDRADELGARLFCMPNTAKAMEGR